MDHLQKVRRDDFKVFIKFYNQLFGTNFTHSQALETRKVTASFLMVQELMTRADADLFADDVAEVISIKSRSSK